MKLILLSTIFLLSNFKQVDKTIVYICGSKKAPKYHYKANCRGLKKCDFKPLKITLSAAQAQGKTLCGWEN